MKVLYIEDNIVINQDIEKAFLQCGCELIHHSAPLKDEKDNTSYLTSFLSIVKEHSPSFVFSPNFFPFVSLACGVLKIPYIAWLTEGFQQDYYSPTIRNEWNCIFAADSILYRDLKNLGVENIFFLPLGAPDLDVDGYVDILQQKKYIADVSAIGTIWERKDFRYNPLSMNSPLKDATKGYLEGCIACQHQLHEIHTMCSDMPSYIWEDLVNAYPIEVGDTLLNKQKYYEYIFFNPLITYAEREMNLSCYTEERYQKVYLYSRNDNYTLENAKNQGWADYHKILPMVARGSKINLVISHRNDRAMISSTAWLVMAAKGFLLSNVQEDYGILERSPITYHNAKEMLSRSAYYYHHEDERKEITEKIYKEIMKKHTYVHRIEEMLSIIW